MAAGVHGRRRTRAPRVRGGGGSARRRAGRRRTRSRLPNTWPPNGTVDDSPRLAQSSDLVLADASGNGRSTAPGGVKCPSPEQLDVSWALHLAAHTAVRPPHAPLLPCSLAPLLPCSLAPLLPCSLAPLLPCSLAPLPPPAAPPPAPPPPAPCNPPPAACVQYHGCLGMAGLGRCPDQRRHPVSLNDRRTWPERNPTTCAGPSTR
jgi:hypothetical protein